MSVSNAQYAALLQRLEDLENDNRYLSHIGALRKEIEGLNKDFFMEVAKGNVVGHSIEILSAKQLLVGTSFETIWGAAGNYTFASSAETLELVSADANDTSAGTGARTVIVSTLSSSYVRQVQTVTMNGTTAVALTGTHLRAHRMIIATAGSGKTNAGEIILRVASAGATRNVMQIGKSITSDGIITVPAGQSLFVIKPLPSFPKDQSGVFAVATTANTANAPRVMPAERSLYQAASDLGIIPSIGIKEKTDIELLALSDNVNQRLDIIFQFMLIDNTLIQS